MEEEEKGKSGLFWSWDQTFNFGLGFIRYDFGIHGKDKVRHLCCWTCG